MSNMIEVVPGLTLETLYDGKIYIWTASQSSKEVIDAWYRAASEMLENWDDMTAPYLVLLDMSRVVLSVYSRRRASAMAEIRPDVNGRTAVVVAATTMGHMTRLFVDKTLQKTRERRVFFSREDALFWLEEAL